MVDVLTKPAARPQRVTVYFLAAQVIAGTGALAVNVLSARGLGPEGRGQIALWLQIGVVAGVLILGGADRAYPAVADHPTLAGAVRDLHRVIRPGMAMVALAGAAVAGWLLLHGGSDGWAAAATILVAAGSAIGAAVRSASAASGHARPFLVSTLAGQGLLIGGCVTLLVLEATSPAVWLTVYGTALIFAFMLAARPAGTTGTDLTKVRRMGHRLAMSTAASIVMMRADRLLLPALAGYAQLGIYGTVATITEMISLPVQAWVDSHVPAWRKAHLAGTLRRGRILSLAAVYALTAATSVTLLLRALVVPMLGEAYRPAVALVLPLAAAAGCYAISRVGVGLAVATGRPGTAAVTDMTAMVVSVAAYLLLIPPYGAMGAALGSLVGYGVAAIIAIVGTTTLNRR